MSKKILNTAFQCEQCGAWVEPLTNGSFRNHCPYCLFSKHMDDKPGDRASFCKGLMEPVEVYFHSKKGYQIVHRCTSCGKIHKNIVAENTVQEDDFLSFIC
ncbi:RNHCP domain-containing protein [Ornithinibacillus sp. L9]|uniref:RNHCP domain-containing protein n=1 Tax=Ornithinibacillus caprae TaxID=2678566 RepID=A0A6N8FN27_9BACI|nr:RNHCP domain-containing protein [Ornithinibacillus caprae]MUK89814.1 RNHCP domain-containing protein [Ornithinibacillus caprae]